MGASKTASKSSSKKNSKLSQLKTLVFGGRGSSKKKTASSPKGASPKARTAQPAKKAAPAPKKAAHPAHPAHPKTAKTAKAVKEQPASPKKGANPNGALSAKGATAVPTKLSTKLSKSAAKAAKSAEKIVTMVNGASVNGNADAEAVCREVACEGLATSGGYCRLHYIKNWKKIKRKELILKERKLNQYIEELVAKYPDKYIEAIRQDLANDKDFAKVIYDLDLDESVDEFDVEGESVENLIDTIKRDFDDEGETF